MGLDIFSSDDVKNFHIGYMGFSTLRGFFILSKYGERLYEDYNNLVKYVISCTFFDEKECPVDEDEFSRKLGDLDILISHSDCGGELTSNECRLLKPHLKVDEVVIKSTIDYQNNPEYVNRMINLMYEFIDLIKYCADDSDVKLIFG